MVIVKLGLPGFTFALEEAYSLTEQVMTSWQFLERAS